MSAFPAITPDRIVGHEHIAPGRKTDPGPAFDWNHYLGQLSILAAPGNSAQLRFLIILLAYVIGRRLDTHQNHSALDASARRGLSRLPAGMGSWPWSCWSWRHSLSASSICVSLKAGGCSGFCWSWGCLWCWWQSGWQETLKAYAEAWQRGDFQAAWHHVRHLVPATRQGLANEPGHLHVTLASRFLVNQLRWLFSADLLVCPAGARRAAIFTRAHADP